tara:strand:+ start:1700 stop:1993 length:294 start_codon:yes stop_codon:yes gene_type:complete
MNDQWWYIKNWFSSKNEKPKEEKVKITKSRTTRKKRNGDKLSKKEVTQIRKFYREKDEFGIETYAEFTTFCNRKLSLDKSRSVYCRIINGIEPYTYS